MVAYGVRLARGVWPWLYSELLNERERWPLWLPVALGGGVAIYFGLSFEPTRVWAGLALFASIACIVGVYGTEVVVLRAGLSMLAAMSLGFAIAKIRTEIVAAPVLSHKLGPIGLDGRVEQSELHGNGIRIVLGELHSRRHSPEAMPARVRISVRADKFLTKPGSWVHLTAVLMPPPSPASQGAYDFGRAAYYLRLGGVGYAYGHLTAIDVPKEASFHDNISLFIEQLRARILRRPSAVSLVWLFRHRAPSLMRRA